ncbi:hypothetical protein AAFF_G00249100 [Aldrovandia affinis]|uniref:Uncharacterized protein n=1 Tax=Aldrovandia affinis TaxID=143900 RepID=A0AAD7RD31_9TELE|nr:hypothetical protein AAFF_G00249100 [Aldrovandia affinis]
MEFQHLTQTPPLSFREEDPHPLGRIVLKLNLGSPNASPHPPSEVDPAGMSWARAARRSAPISPGADGNVPPHFLSLFRLARPGMRQAR